MWTSFLMLYPWIIIQLQVIHLNIWMNFFPHRRLSKHCIARNTHSISNCTGLNFHWEYTCGKTINSPLIIQHLNRGIKYPTKFLQMQCQWINFLTLSVKHSVQCNPVYVLCQLILYFEVLNFTKFLFKEINDITKFSYYSIKERVPKSGFSKSGPRSLSIWPVGLCCFCNISRLAL